MPKPRTAPPLPIPTRQQLALNQTRMDKRDRAVMKLDIFQTELLRRASGWRIAARLVGEAYKIADNNYKETLEKKKATDALEMQIFFSILTVATSGALGWMSVAGSKQLEGVAASMKLEDAFLDARDATLQAMSGEVFSANGPLVFPPSADTTVSQDPQVYQDELENKVDSLVQEALQAFIKIRKTYLDAPLEAWDKYDVNSEEAAHRDWMKTAAQLAGKDDLPKVDWMARELERGRWAKYILDNHSYRDFGIFQTADTPDYVGGDVHTRLGLLGVAQAAINTQNAMISPGQEIKREIAAAWDWAKNYKPRRFEDEKKNPGKGGADHQ